MVAVMRLIMEVKFILYHAHVLFVFFFSSRRRHTRFDCDWSSDVCSSDLREGGEPERVPEGVGDERGEQDACVRDRAAQVAQRQHLVSGQQPVAERREGERSEEHTSELQSQSNLVCRLLLEKKKTHNTSVH